MRLIRRALRTRLARRAALVLGVFLAIGVLTAWNQWQQRRQQLRHRQEFMAIAYDAARRHGVDPCLVMGVIQTESAWRADATGKAGEIGLMQITPGAAADWERVTGRRYGARSALYTPALNVEIGTWYLARALQRWADRQDPVIWALVQYNAGPTRAGELAGVHREIGLAEVPIPITRTYIERVTHHRDTFRDDGLCQTPPQTANPPSTP
jgi:soluble lytic murein transglycosylase